MVSSGVVFTFGAILFLAFANAIKALREAAQKAAHDAAKAG
ncbi:hypothetical protein [Variovorax sp. IB41]|nr:hypothetical protein [Variovorax sp. IB41]